jgi:hypothetical protein
VLTYNAAAVVAAILITMTSAATQEPPNRCQVVPGSGQCLVSAIDPGRPGGPQKPKNVPKPKVAPPPRPTEPPQPLPDGAINGAQLGLPGNPRRPNPGAPAPAVIAQEAIKALDLRGPHVDLSARGSTFVGAPVWLWIDRGAQFTGPLSTTATAGAAQVTVTGMLTAVEWDLGPPGAHVNCAGPGTPWTGQAGSSPDCGYTYSERSLPERTNGTGRWPVTATSVWQVTWTGTSAGAPVSGSQTVRVPAQASLAVGEIQVLVAGS